VNSFSACELRKSAVGILKEMPPAEPKYAGLQPSEMSHENTLKTECFGVLCLGEAASLPRAPVVSLSSFFSQGGVIHLNDVHRLFAERSARSNTGCVGGFTRGGDGKFTRGRDDG